LVLVKDIEERMNNALNEGIKLPKTERLVLLAKSALDRGDYQTAIDRANDAKITYALERVGKINVFRFVTNNWQAILVGFIALSLVIYLGFLLLKYNIIKHKLKSARKEEEILLGLIKETQRDCFERNNKDKSFQAF
jgi:hypothetical protein